MQDQTHSLFLGPYFTYDHETVHQYREVSDIKLVLRNFTSVQRHSTPPGGRKLKKYRGVIATRAFKSPGKYYFETRIGYNITRPLDNINFVFEIALCHREDIDQNYYVYDKQRAWSLCGQHCEEHSQLCVYCRHHGYNLVHVPLSQNSTGTSLERLYGFLIDTDGRRFSVIDITRHRLLHTFCGLDFTDGLWPVFGCHWPSKVKLEMTLRTGHQIEHVSQAVHEL